MSAGAEGPDPRAQALAALRLGFEALAGQLERLERADSDAGRRALLLALVDQAWTVRDRAAEAYAALDRERDADGLGRGVVE